MKLHLIKKILMLMLLLFLNFSYVYAKTLTFTDVYGRKVSLNVPVKRACLLVTYELVPALKIRNQVVAVGKWAYDAPIMKATVPDLNNIPSPGVGGPGVNVELLKRLGTELIVTFRVPPEELNFLEAKGIKAFAIYPNSIKELLEVIRWHGVVFGKEKEAERAIKEMEKVLRLIEERISKIPFSKRKKVIWLHSDPTSVAGGNGIVNDTLLKIGGINPAASLFPDSSIASLKGLTVVMTLHDPTLASLFSDKIVVINSGNKIAEGSPKEVLTEELIKRVYGIDVVRVSYNGKNIIYPNLY